MLSSAKCFNSFCMVCRCFLWALKKIHHFLYNRVPIVDILRVFNTVLNTKQHWTWSLCSFADFNANALPYQAMRQGSSFYVFLSKFIPIFYLIIMIPYNVWDVNLINSFHINSSPSIKWRYILSSWVVICYCIVAKVKVEFWIILAKVKLISLKGEWPSIEKMFWINNLDLNLHHMIPNNDINLFPGFIHTFLTNVVS